MDIKLLPVSMKSINGHHFIEKSKKKLKNHDIVKYSQPNHISFNGNTIFNAGIDKSYGDQYSDEEPLKPKRYNKKRAMSNSNVNNLRNHDENMKIYNKFTAVGAKRSLQYRKYIIPQVIDVNQEVSK
jgi:hypothetical protein